jgi:hypothetical protein
MSAFDFTPPTLSAVVAEVRRIAAEHPDTIYASVSDQFCTYVRDGAGDCIIGRALTSLGVPIAFFYQEHPSPHGVTERLNTTGISHIFPNLFSWHGDEIRWLYSVQCAQDHHKPWGEAVERADRLHPLASIRPTQSPAVTSEQS